MGILYKARLLSINEICRSSQRIAVVVWSSMHPLKIHLPRKDFMINTNYKLCIVCRIILLKLSCGRYICSSVPHHSQKSFCHSQHTHVISHTINWCLKSNCLSSIKCPQELVPNDVVRDAICSKLLPNVPNCRYVCVGVLTVSCFLLMYLSRGITGSYLGMIYHRHLEGSRAACDPLPGYSQWKHWVLEGTRLWFTDMLRRVS